MGVLEESYEQLKIITAKEYNHKKCNVDIHSLKRKFTSEINSVRCLSQITDISSLLLILEKRSVLSPVQIKPLQIIFSVLDLDGTLLNKHNTMIFHGAECLFTQEYEAESPRNGILDNRHQFNNLSINNQHKLNVQTPSMNRGVLSDRVVKTVCSQIGHSWKRLARYLKVIQECTINEIEENPTLKTHEMRAKMILEELEQNEIPVEVIPRLLSALKLAKRMDLHDTVMKIVINENLS